MNGPNKFVFDTNAVIALLAGQSRIAQLADEADWLGISVVTCIEFQATHRLTSNDVSLFNEFVKRVEVIGLSPSEPAYIAEVVRIRKLKNLKLPDAIIVATASINTAVLLTADRRIHQTGLVECKSF
jgi:predicted nucleic acid-binding protein